jgi:hypothetical protein
MASTIENHRAKKIHLISISLAGVLLLAFAIWLSMPAYTVNAQCKNLSSCKNCHEVQAQKPVNSVGAWHTDHANYDLCAVCHGGAREAQTAEEAHAGLKTNLADMPASCRECHSADLESKFQVYASALNVTDRSALDQAQNTSALTGLSDLLGAQAARAAPLPGAASSAVAPGAAAKPAESKPVNVTGNWVLAGLLIAGVLGGGSAITWNERRRAQAGQARAAGWLVAQLRKEHWSPYAAGVLLGITCILSVVLAQRTLGASSAVSTLASSLVNQAAPGSIGDNMYFKFLMPPGFNWEVALLIGIFFGGLFGALSSGTFRLRWNGDPAWNKIYGTQRWKRFVVGFLGAILLQYGAGIAGGCTSGLAISGGMLLAPSAFLFMAGMFISGIVVTIIVFRRRY